MDDVYREKIAAWKDRGIKVTRLESLLASGAPDEEILSAITAFAQGVQRLAALAEELGELDAADFPEDKLSIGAMLQDVDSIPDAEGAIEELHMKVELARRRKQRAEREAAAPPPPPSPPPPPPEPAVVKTLDERKVLFDSLKEKVVAWRAEGYNTDRLNAIVARGDVDDLRTESALFSVSIQHLGELKAELERVAAGLPVEERKAAGALLKEPDRTEDLEKELSRLEELAARRAEEEEGARESAKLKSGFQKRLDRWKGDGWTVTRLEKVVLPMLEKDRSGTEAEFRDYEENMARHPAVLAKVEAFAAEGLEEEKRVLLERLGRKDADAVPSVEKGLGELEKRAAELKRFRAKKDAEARERAEEARRREEEKRRARELERRVKNDTGIAAAAKAGVAERVAAKALDAPLPIDFGLDHRLERYGSHRLLVPIVIGLGLLAGLGFLFLAMSGGKVTYHWERRFSGFVEFLILSLGITLAGGGAFLTLTGGLNRKAGGAAALVVGAGVLWLLYMDSAGLLAVLRTTPVDISQSLSAAVKWSYPFDFYDSLVAVLGAALGVSAVFGVKKALSTAFRQAPAADIVTEEEVGEEEAEVTEEEEAEADVDEATEEEEPEAAEVTKEEADEKEAEVTVEEEEETTPPSLPQKEPEAAEETECPECHKAIPADAQQCPHCGVQFEEEFVCPACNSVVGADDAKCPKCGATFEEG